MDSFGTLQQLPRRTSKLAWAKKTCENTQLFCAMFPPETMDKGSGIKLPLLVGGMFSNAMGSAGHAVPHCCGKQSQGCNQKSSGCEVLGSSKTNGCRASWKKWDCTRIYTRIGVVDDSFQKYIPRPPKFHLEKTLYHLGFFPHMRLPRKKAPPQLLETKVWHMEALPNPNGYFQLSLAASPRCRVVGRLWRQ